MRCLISNNSQELTNIISQINIVCGWPDGHTQTATTVQWSDVIQMYWCSIEDSRVLEGILQVNLGLLTIEDHPRTYFEIDALLVV